MRATQEDFERLDHESQRLTGQLVSLGAIKVILFGSLARGKISLFSDIDLLAIFDDSRTSKELTGWVYQNLDTGEAVDVLAYNVQSFDKMKERTFIRHILSEGKVLYERPQD